MEGHSYLRTHSLKGEHLILDLGGVVTELHGEAAKGQTKRAITLVKEGGLNLVLLHLHRGGVLEEHSAPGVTTVQILDGHVRMKVGDEDIDLPLGRIIAFDANVSHSVEALEDSTLILTLVNPQADE